MFSFFSLSPVAVELFANQVIEYLLRIHDYSEHALLGLFIGSALSAPPPAATTSVRQLNEAAAADQVTNAKQRVVETPCRVERGLGAGWED